MEVAAQFTDPDEACSMESCASSTRASSPTSSFLMRSTGRMHTTGAAAGGCAAAPCCSVSELDPMPPASFVTLMGIVDMQLAGQWPASHTQTITAGAAGARAARRATKARRSHRRSRRGEGLFELDEYELPGQPGARPWEVDLKALRTAPKADDLYRKYQREIDQEPHELTLRNKKLSLLRELSRSNFEDVRRLLLGESLKDPEPEHNDGEATSDSSSHSQCECVCDLAMFGDYDRILKGELERTAVRGASRRQIPAVGIQWSNVLSSIGDLSKVEAPVGQTEEPRPPTLRTAHTLKSAIDGVLPSGSTARRQLDDAVRPPPTSAFPPSGSTARRLLNSPVQTAPTSAFPPSGSTARRLLNSPAPPALTSAFPPSGSTARRQLHNVVQPPLTAGFPFSGAAARREDCSDVQAPVTPSVPPSSSTARRLLNSAVQVPPAPSVPSSGSAARRLVNSTLKPKCRSVTKIEWKEHTCATQLSNFMHHSASDSRNMRHSSLDRPSTSQGILHPRARHRASTPVLSGCLTNGSASPSQCVSMRSRPLQNALDASPAKWGGGFRFVPASNPRPNLAPS